MVAMSVGACLGGDEPCREQIAEKQKSDLSGPEETVFRSTGFSKILLTAQPGQYLDS